MTDPEKIHALASELGIVLNRYRCEMEMTLASMIGTLEVVKLSLYGEEERKVKNDPFEPNDE